MNYLKTHTFGLACLVAGFGLLAVPLRAQYTGPAVGQKVAFLGDSITQLGTGPGGYVTSGGQGAGAEWQKKSK